MRPIAQKQESERIAELESLCELQIALATKNIRAHYEALKLHQEPPQLGRSIFDRRCDGSWSGLAERFTTVQQPSDMADVNLHLSI